MTNAEDREFTNSLSSPMFMVSITKTTCTITSTCYKRSTIMTTLKLKANTMPPQHIDDTIVPHVPHFLVQDHGTVAFLVRNSTDLFFTERWTQAAGFITEADSADAMEIADYVDGYNIDIPDVPEPIDVLTAEAWDICTSHDDLDMDAFIERAYA